MANIPINTDFVSPEATPITASMSGSPVGEAMGGFGRTVAGVGLRLGEVQKQIKNVDDARWANEQYLASKDQVSQFMATPEVAQAEDIATRIKEHASSVVQGVDPKSAPSPEAYRLYKEHFTGWSAAQIARSYDNGFQNKVNNTVNSAKAQIDQAIATFRTTLGEGADNAAVYNLGDSVASVKAFISKGFDEFSPKIARSLNDYATTQTVLAVAKVNPGAAKSFLDSDNTIDEQTRRHLESEINSAAKVKNTAEVFQFNEMRKNNTQSAWELGQRSNPLSLEHYTDFLGPEQGKIAKIKDDEAYQLAGDHKEILNKVAGWSEPYLNDTLSRLSALKSSGGPNASYNKDLYEATAKSLSDAIHLQRTDVVKYLDVSNPHIGRVADELNTAQQKLAANPSDAQAQTKYSVALKAYNDTHLLYQGPVPMTVDATGKVILAVSPDEAKRYLGKSQNEQSLLTVQKAQDYAKTLNVSTPEEFIGKTHEILSGYTDDTHAMIAFNDMVVHGKLNQQYQLAWLNKDEGFVHAYLGAIKAGSAIKLPEADYKTLESAVLNNPNVKNLMATMVGDNSARAKELEGFTTGIIQWAKVLASDGTMTLKVAANHAADKLLSSKLGFTSVNGKPLMVLRDDGKGNKRTDEQINDLGRRLEFVPQFIPLSQVDQTNFPRLQEAPKGEHKLKALSDHLASSSFWQVGPDGKSASLYVQGDDGAFQVRDVNKQPFIVKFDKLPAFAPVQKTSTPGLPGQGQRTVTEIPGVRTASLFKFDTMGKHFYSGFHYSGGMRAQRYPGVTENNTDKKPSWMD